MFGLTNRERGLPVYDYMSSIEKFQDEHLPSKVMFYSQLSEDTITDEDYEKAKVRWKHFKIKNMGEYHDLYLKTDVLLLTDILENFRGVCIQDYGLDLVYFYTLPNLLLMPC